MEPSRDMRYTLVDLLDRVLERGLVIHADVIISVAGIPLIGVTLRAALAGMETMLKYGVMKDWDEATRVWHQKHRVKKEPALSEGEEIILRVFGSHHYHEGIYIAWRYGFLYLTNRRLFLYSQDFNELLFQTPLEKIKGMGIKTERHFLAKDAKTGWDGLLAARASSEKEREVLYLLLEGDQWARIHVRDVAELKGAIEQPMRAMGLTPEEPAILPDFFDEKVPRFLAEGEKITHGAKAWYQLEATGIIGDTWRPGHLYVTNNRLCWWYDFEEKSYFEVPLDRILGASTSVRDFSGMLKKKGVLDIIYQDEQEKRVVTFSGEGLTQWKRVIDQIVAQQGVEALEEAGAETCPQCGREGPTKVLLERGCPKCGWTSPRLKEQLAEAAAAR